jgi:hypothetical protein
MARELGRPEKRGLGQGGARRPWRWGAARYGDGHTARRGALAGAGAAEELAGREAAQGAGPRASKGGRRPGLEDAAALADPGFYGS